MPYGAWTRSGSTSRPLYVPQVGQTRCGRFGWPHVGQTLTFGALIACVARRLSRRDFEVFRFGTAIAAGHYSLRRVQTTEILALFDEQMRRRAAPDNLVVGEGWSGVIWRPDDGEVEPLVARMRELPGYVEWKYYSHDGPELRERLLEAGLEPEDEETVVVAEAASIPPPSGDVELRLATDEFDELAARVFGGRAHGLPENAVAVVAMVDGEPVSGGRVDFEEGVEFAGLFGGVTLPEYRGRGLYRATVARRAELARERGYRWLYSDALPTSRPILERVGFVAITTTTPFTFPAAAR
jgi:GNAT superfamily N-acetyltransferase